MYNNNVYEDYIRQVLGYPNNVQRNDNYMEYSNVNIEQDELEACYPEIYKLVYPMINKRCNQINGPITNELIEQITEEIASAIEPANEIGVNINIQNNTRATAYNEDKILEVNKVASDKNINSKQENTKENRGGEAESGKRVSRRGGLSDLIKILIIRELLGRPNMRPPMPGSRPPFPPRPRPPFPGGERPPMGHPPMPRGYYEYSDIYEM